VGQLSQKTGLPSTYVKPILECALLSPQISETVLSGKHLRNLTLRALLQNVPIGENSRIESFSCRDEIRSPVLG